MKLTTAQKLYSGLATGVTIVIIVGCLSYASFRSQMNEAEWVDHTHEVLQTSAKIRQLITEMETGRRAFRSTGDSLLLEVYDSAHAEIQPVLRHLEKLVADNRTQTSKATAISKGLYSLITYWGSLNQPTTSLSPNRIRGIVYTEKRYMDQLKQFLDEFDKKEAQLLVNRKAETKQSAQLAIRTLLAGLALILIIVSILSYYVYRELVNRISVQRTLRNNLKEMEAMNADMNEKNWQLTGLSQISNQLQGHFTASGLAAS